MRVLFLCLVQHGSQEKPVSQQRRAREAHMQRRRVHFIRGSQATLSLDDCNQRSLLCFFLPVMHVLGRCVRGGLEKLILVFDMRTCFCLSLISLHIACSLCLSLFPALSRSFPPSPTPSLPLPLVVFRLPFVWRIAWNAGILITCVQSKGCRLRHTPVSLANLGCLLLL